MTMTPETTVRFDEVADADSLTEFKKAELKSAFGVQVTIASVAFKTFGDIPTKNTRSSLIFHCLKASVYYDRRVGRNYLKTIRVELNSVNRDHFSCSSFNCSFTTNEKSERNHHVLF